MKIAGTDIQVPDHMGLIHKFLPDHMDHVAHAFQHAFHGDRHFDNQVVVALKTPILSAFQSISYTG